MNPQAYGPTLFGLTATDIGTLLAAIAVFAMLIALYTASTVRDPMSKRVKVLNARREQLKTDLTPTIGKKRNKITHQNDATDRIRSVLKPLKLLQTDQIRQVEDKLAQAGIRSKDWAVAVIFGQLLLPIAIGGTAFFLIYAIDFWPDWSPLKRFIVFAILLFGSYKAPEIYLDNITNKRSTAIRKGIPDALDLLVICAEAGLTVDAAFGRVARELGSAFPELSDEFQLTSIELSFLSERRMAFENLAKRVKVDAMKGVVTTMIQTEKYGTPLASSLRVLSAEFRNTRMMKAEEKAARLPAIMTIPLILFILPVLFVVILGPAACNIRDKFINPV